MKKTKLFLVIFGLLTIGQFAFAQSGSTFTNSDTVVSLPYLVSGETTCGFGNNYTTTSIACTGNFMSGEEKIYSFTPTSNMNNIEVSISNISDNFSGLFITDDTVASGNCIGSVTDPTSNDRVISGLSLTANTTYYIIVSSWANPTCVASYDINIVDQTCPAVDSLGIANLTATSVDLTWVENGLATQWSIEYGASGFTQGTGAGTIVTATSNPYALGSLTPTDSYDYYVSADCGGLGTSYWVGPFSFTTPCLPLLAPVTESFDIAVLPTCWGQTAVTGGPWTLTGTPGWGAAAVTDHTGNGGGYIWMDFSGTDASVSLQTAEIDVTNLNVPFLEFYFYTNNTTNATTINSLMVEAWDGNNWITVDSIRQNNLGWAKFGYNLSTLTFGANLVKIQFRAEPDNGVTDAYVQDFVLDDISIIESPTCPDPSSLAAATAGTYANLSWVEQGSATQWEIEYGTPGFVLGAGTAIIPVSSNPYTLNSLTITTSYEYYVRSVCGVGDSSLWVGPFAFTTTPACPQPVSLDATVTGNSAVISWTENGTPALWEYEFGVVGFTQGTGTSNTTSVDSATLSSLPYSTTYSFYVRSICGAADSSLWSGPYSFTTPCAVVLAPYTQSFDITSTPNCWTQAAILGGPWVFGGTPGWGSSGAVEHTGNGGYFAWMDFSGTDESVTLTTLEVDVTALNVPYLEFYFYTNNTDEASINDLMVEAWDGTNWALVDSIHQNLGGWTEFAYDLTGFTYGANIVQIRFRAESGAGTPFYQDFLLDDVKIMEMPTCISPNNIVSTTELTSITIDWNERASATMWGVQYDTAGFTLGTGIDSITTAHPFTINGLNATTDYQFYVRAICGAGDSSIWEGPYTATTLPDYCAGAHFYDNGGVSGAYAANSNDTTVICPDNAGNVVEAMFNSFNTEAGLDLLYVYDGDNTSAALLGTFSGTTAPGPFVGSSASGCLTFVFISSAFTNNAGWDATINCVTPPTCPFPTNLTAGGSSLTTAVLSWTENGFATQWEVELGAAGFTPTGTGTLTATNPMVTTVASYTAYEYYVRSVCGSNDSSSWVGPFAFRIDFTSPGYLTCANGAMGIIFSDEMEDNTGWTGDISTASADWDFPTAGPGGNSSSTGPSGPASGVTFAEFEASSAGVNGVGQMISPMIDLTTVAGSAELSFYMHAYGQAMGDLDVGVSTSATGPFTSVFIHSGQYQTAAADPWAHVGVDISAYAGQQIYVSFTNYHYSTQWYGDRAIDLVEVKGCLSCPSPDSLYVANATPTSLDFGWNETGAATFWEIEYDDSIGFVFGTGIRMTSSASPESFTGLNANSDYEFYVRAICGAGDSSSWSGPFSTTTPCSVISTFPFLESFDVTSPTIGCWVNEYEVGQSNWTLDYGATGGAITAPQTGNYNLTFVSTTGTNDPITNAVSPTFDLTALSVPRMSFYYGQEEFFGDQNYTRVLYRVGPTDPWVAIWSDSTNVDVWTKVTLYLPNPSATYQIAFQGINNFGQTNVVDEFIVEDTPANDLLVLEVNSLGGACGLGLDSIQAVVVNNGSANQTGFSMGFSLNGTSITPEVVSSTVLAFDTMVYTFTTLGNFSTPGAYDLVAYSMLTGDVKLSNDTATSSVNKTFYVDSYPYIETFATGQEGWFIDNDLTGTWTFGTPNKPSLVGAASDTNAFVTGGLSGTYNANELGYVTGPCFDFTSLDEPYVQLSVWWETEFSWDGGQVQYSVDGGDTWTMLGDIGEGESWYTDNTVSGLDNTSGWSGRNGSGSDGWEIATIPAPMLAGVSSVNLRVAFGSDGSGQDEGFAFDNFSVFNGANLGNDTVLCTSDTLTLDPGNSLGYLWSDGSITPVYYLDAAVLPEGTDTVEVIVAGPGGYKLYDTVVVLVEKPTVSIGNDTILCYGESITLTADAGFNSYLWNDNTTMQSTQTNGTVVGATDYYVIVTTVNNCPAIDSVNVSVNTEVLVDLGNDTTFWDSATQGVNILLDAGPGFNSYLWHDGSTGQTLLAQTGTATEIYVVVTNASGCEGTDTINVVFNLSVNSLETSTISMYPNPTSDFINISVSNFAALGAVNVKVLDITGKVVITDKLEGNGNVFNRGYDVSSLATGTYFVQFEANGEVATRQFVIK